MGNAFVWRVFLWAGALAMAIIGGIATFQHPVGSLSGGWAIVVFVIGLCLLIVPFVVQGLFY